jgi:hypothetical protein
MDREQFYNGQGIDRRVAPVHNREAGWRVAECAVIPVSKLEYRRAARGGFLPVLTSP